jgi:hypothetical protein
MPSWPHSQHNRPGRIAILAQVLLFLGASPLGFGCRSQGSPDAVAAREAPSSEVVGATEPAGPSSRSPVGALDIIDLGPGRFAVRANTLLQLASMATLERRTGSNGFVAVPLEGGFSLTESCEKPASPASGCRTLRAGEVLALLGWDGGNCAGPCCPSPAAAPTQSGAYRLVISQCGDPNVRWTGPEFSLPRTTNAIYRARAAVLIESASVMQLRALDVVADLAPDPGRVAGVAIVAGTEVALNSEGVSALGRWLGGAGFDDRVVRRCKRGDAFGVRIVRKPPGLDPELTEVAVDLSCNSLAVVHQEGLRRSRFDSFFDASREELVQILKNAMPKALDPSAPR